MSLFVDDAARRGQSAARAAIGTLLVLVADFSAFLIILVTGAGLSVHPPQPEIVREHRRGGFTARYWQNDLIPAAGVVAPRMAAEAPDLGAKICQSHRQTNQAPRFPG